MPNPCEGWSNVLFQPYNYMGLVSICNLIHDLIVGVGEDSLKLVYKPWERPLCLGLRLVHVIESDVNEWWLEAKSFCRLEKNPWSIFHSQELCLILVYDDNCVSLWVFFFPFKVDYVLMNLSYDTLDTHDDAHPVMVFYAREIPHGPHD